MIKAKITTDLKLLTGNKLAQEIEYSTAQALTATAFDIQKSTKNKLTGWVNITNRFLQSQVIVNKANIRNLKATVGFSELTDDIPLRLEEGGIRKKKNARNVSIPTRNVRRTARGGISRAKRPPAQIRRKDVWIERRGSTLGIWRKKGKDTIELLYTLKPFTKYKGNNIHFIDNATRVAQVKYYRNFEQIFKRNINKTLQKMGFR